MIIAGHVIPNWVLTVGILSVAAAYLSSPAGKDVSADDKELEDLRLKAEQEEKAEALFKLKLKPEIVELIKQEARTRWSKSMTDDEAEKVLDQIIDVYAITLDNEHKVKIVEKQIELYRDELARAETNRAAMAG